MKKYLLATALIVSVTCWQLISTGASENEKSSSEAKISTYSDEGTLAPASVERVNIPVRSIADLKKDWHKFKNQPELLGMVREELETNGGISQRTTGVENVSDELRAERFDCTGLDNAIRDLATYGEVAAPAVENFRDLSFLAWGGAKGVMVTQGLWLRENRRVLEIAHATPRLQFDGTGNPLRLPPEALAVMLVGESWSTMIKEVPSLSVSLSAIREDILLEYGEAFAWRNILHNEVLGALWGEGVLVPNDVGRPVDWLSQFYPPLAEVNERLNLEIPFEYQSRIEQELILAGMLVLEENRIPTP